MIFCILIGMMIWMFSGSFKRTDAWLAEKIKEYLSSIPGSDLNEMIIPTLSITKSWKVEGEVMGELTLTSSGETSKIAKENLNYLFELSCKHDKQCMPNKKEKDVCIG